MVLPWAGQHCCGHSLLCRGEQDAAFSLSVSIGNFTLMAKEKIIIIIMYVCVSFTQTFTKRLPSLISLVGSCHTSLGSSRGNSEETSGSGAPGRFPGALAVPLRRGEAVRGQRCLERAQEARKAEVKGGVSHLLVG